MRINRELTIFIVSTLTTVTVAVATPGMAFADDSITTPREVAAALSKLGSADNALVAPAALSITDSNSAAQTATVDIPTDPIKGIKLSDGRGQIVTVGLPHASNSGKGDKTASGAVAYAGKGGSANAVIPTVNGAQFMTIIEGRRATTRYDYALDLPKGATVQVSTNGGAVVFDKANNLLGVMPAPWAKDAAGRAVKTRFTTDGKTLTQHVEHKVRSVTYPVTTDPYFMRWWGIEVQLDRRQTNLVMFGAAYAAVAGLWIPDPFLSKVIASILGLFSGYAGWAYNEGACIAMGRNWAGGYWIWHYYGGSCR